MMKQAVISFLLIVFTASLGFAQSNDGQSEEAGSKPVIQFENTTHDYGEIEYKGDGTCSFTFENAGEEPLLLTKVKASCGCTTPSWPKEPIKQGETDTIKVKYNTRIKGNFSKSIRVYSNAENSPVLLRLKGKVASTSTESNK
ncbi:MAG: DUF1573 domain-containing protein [Bacteroidota bacterium]